MGDQDRERKEDFFLEDDSDEEDIEDNGNNDNSGFGSDEDDINGDEDGDKGSNPATFSSHQWPQNACNQDGKLSV
ncbi:hypothetical protein Patl1_02707 [Pistacia atlantica]|uniref:Uncharacterized protein n=1 Tax=Pistacia atlantica TaxID=434234 RepID=A0ACC1C4K2_9ROSI|nr:hypothetical protein Patl1_02707 [Pistacia atlantica]